ncbi:MAG: RluA family pseudouridine synthase [Neomegalonema sp.]|nr:RluA family pseudouridine synthase [Neomegalonema sp.]
MPGVRKIRVGADEAEQRLDRWFKRNAPEFSHARLEKALRKGEVRVDGARAKASDRVRPGQEIRVPPAPDQSDDARPAPRRDIGALSDEDAALAQSMVIYRDDALIALNKQPGLAVQGGSGQTRHVDRLLDALKFERQDRPRLIHRLDKDTSGVLLLARTGAAATAMARAFHGRDARKTYWAALTGAPKPRSGEIRYSLVKAPGRGGEKMLCLPPEQTKQVEGAKRALTVYATLEAMGDRASWAALRPVTGRTHQLRAHMGEIGCPIVGDGKYGSDPHKIHGLAETPYLGGEISRKLHLHARRIELPHPATGRPFVISAPLPEHMRRTWQAFGWSEADAPEDPFADYDEERRK